MSIRRICVGQAMRGSVALGLFAILLVGCGTPVPPTPTPEPIKIYFAFPAEQATYYDDLIAQFNETHPGVTVERKTAMTTETWNYLFQEKLVDAFTFSTESDFFPRLKAEDGLLDLTPLTQQSDTFNLDDFYPSVLEPFAIEGSVWAIPGSVTLGVVYYNKDLFDQYGADYPEMDWTWDDLLRAALQVRDPEQNIYGLVAFPFFTIPFIYQHGGQIMDDWDEPTRLTLDDPLTIEAVDWFASLAYQHDVMPSPATERQVFGQNGNSPYLFLRGKAGMYMGWLTDRGGETWGPQGEWKMRWGVVPLPRNERAATLGIEYAYAISAHTRYSGACWEWLTFLGEQLPPYTMPVRKSLAQSDAYREQVGDEEADVALASIEHMLLVYDLPGDVEFDIEGFMNTVIEILNGNVTALEGLTALQRQSKAQ